VHFIFGATSNQTILERFLNYPGDAMLKLDHNGCLPIHYAMRCNASVDIVQHMMGQHPGQAQMTDIHGETPLHAACKHRCPLEIVKIFVNYNPGLKQIRDIQGCTPLHAACSGGASLDVINYLTDGDSDGLTMLDDKGELALHKACRRGNASVIQYLAKNNMQSVSARNHYNLLPIFILCDQLDKEEEILQSTEYVESIFRLLRAYPETVNP
jgi:ankyrin repeat protein